LGPSAGVEAFQQRVALCVIGGQETAGLRSSRLDRSGAEREQRAVDVEKHYRVVNRAGHHRQNEPATVRDGSSLHLGSRW
jgi:hypothetical protein